MLLRVSGWWLVLLLLSPILRAEPLDRKQLPAATKWFVHLDLDAAHRSALQGLLKETLLAQPGARQGLRNLQEALGMDPLKDIHSVTLYNTSFTKDEVVFIGRGNIDQKRLVALVTPLTGHRIAAYGAHKIHSWTEQNGPRAGGTTSGAFVGDHMLVIGPGEAAVRAALDVLDSKARSADRSASLPAMSEPGTIVEAAATGLSEADLDARSPVVQQCQTLGVLLGERESEVFVKGRLATKRPEIANQIRTALQGLAAIAQLKAADDPEAAEVLGPLQVSSDGAAVAVEWHMPAVRAVQMLKAKLEKAQAADAKTEKSVE